MSIYVARPAENPYAGLFSAIGMAMGENAKQRDSANAYMKLAEMSGPQQQPQPQLWQGGLLGSATTPQANLVQNFQQGLMKQQPDVTSRIANSFMPIPKEGLFNTQPQQTQQAPQAQQQTPEAQQFYKDQAEHPEWFVGGTYVGDDAEARAKAEANTPQTVQQPTQQTTQPTPQSTPQKDNYTIPDKMTIQQRYNKEMYTKMAEMARGGANMKEMVPLIQQHYQGKAQQEYDSQVDKVVGSQFDSVSAESDPKKQIAGFMKLNMTLKRAGRDGVDVALIKEAIHAEDMELKYVNAGDRTEIQVARKDGRPLGVGADGQPVYAQSAGTIAHGVSPDKIYGEEQANYRHSVPSGNAILSANTRGSRGTNGKPSKVEAWAVTYESGTGLANDTATIDTLYGQENLTLAQQKELQKALARRDQYWQISSGGAYNNGQPEQQPQAQSSSPDMAAAYAQEWQSLVDKGWTQERAYQYMTEKYGGQ